MIIKKIPSLSVIAISLVISTQTLAATDCSKDAIGFYLDKGFSPEQISRMCQYSPAVENAVSTQMQPSVNNEQATITKQNIPVLATDGDFLFFNKTILSNSLTVTPDTLTYVRDECVRYGEEDEFTSFRPKVCGMIKTTINRVGLKVLRAVKGLSIIRDAELLVQGDIRRQVLNVESLNSKDRKVFEKVLDKTPDTFNIETREDADPEEVAKRLAR